MVGILVSFLLGWSIFSGYVSFREGKALLGPYFFWGGGSFGGGTLDCHDSLRFSSESNGFWGHVCKALAGCLATLEDNA